MNQLNFKGIVRSTSPQNNADGNCEEIINLRLYEGSWCAVGKKQAIVEGVGYERVYVHQYGSLENFIGLKEGKVFWFASRKGDSFKSKDQEICSISGDIEFSHLNNILLVKGGGYITKAVFEDEEYNIAILELPDIPEWGVVLQDNRIPEYSEFTPLNIHVNKYEEMEAACEMIRSLINKEKDKDSEYSEGYVFICTTYQLFDGTETKPSTPVLVKVGEYVSGLIGAESEPQYDGSDTNITARIRVGDMKLQKLQIKVVNDLPEKYKDMITKVNVYATKAYSFYDMDAIHPENVKKEGVVGISPVVDERKLEAGDVEKMLFYKVGSVDAMEKDSDLITVGQKAITTNETMPVDASGWVNTTGKMFVYNNRLHLYDTSQKFVESRTLGYSWLVRKSYQQMGDARDMVAVVYLKVNGKNIVLHYDCLCTETSLAVLEFSRAITFPDSRAYRIEFYDRYHTCTPVVINLKPSDTYNFAFGLLDQTTHNLKLEATSPILPYVVNGVTDTMNLIASEVMNPYYFPPEHSYLMPGEIINIAVNTEQISTSQVGQFPLYVFTTQGIYALQVGDGKVLYSNVIPISAEVAVKGSEVLQTKYGIIFVTDKGLKLISGQQVVDFSEAVDGKPDEAIRSSKEYKFAVGDEKICNVSPYLSIVSFSDYVGKAVMGYDITEDEVIISNPAYKYSYVFSLKTKTWHKITDVFSDFNQYLGLQSYEAGAVAAKATIFIRTSVVSGNLTKFTKAVSLPEIVFEPGMLTVSIGIMGSRSELFSCSVDETTNIMQLLEEEVSIPELQFKILADEGKVYTNMPFTNLILEHDRFPEAQFYPFVAEERDLPLTPVGVGETFSIKLGGRTFSHVTDGTETSAKVATMIAVWMKKLDLGYDILLENGDLNIIAQPGAEGNKIELICTSSPHVVFISSGFQGGADLSVKNRVCDIRKEMPEDRKILIQTRPILLGTNGFKKLPNVLFRGEFCPVDGKQHRIYIFGSNDLKNYVCTSSGAFGYRRVNVRLRGSYGSYRYYVIMMEGDVMPGHTIVQMETDEQLKLGNRLR